MTSQTQSLHANLHSVTTATKGIIKNNPLLGVAMGADVVYQDKSAQAVIAWGRKPFYGKKIGFDNFSFRLKSSFTKATSFAQAHALPLVTLEMAFCVHWAVALTVWGQALS